ncbi:hypothetical protein ABH926_006432 [Catenulispora sp. GP43]|uniref:hypothetical protein n=1 Tax=Catenulispora sp. GP43 TaxID=3156263 RepID=UPI0035164CEB
MKTSACPTGWKSTGYFMDTPASVMVVAAIESGTLVMVRQYRHNLKRHTVELSVGGVSDGEDPEDAALVVKDREPILDNVIEQYFDMSVVEIPVVEVFDRLGHDIDGMETVGALLLARPHLISVENRCT